MAYCSYLYIVRIIRLVSIEQAAWKSEMKGYEENIEVNIVVHANYFSLS